MSPSVPTTRAGARAGDHPPARGRGPAHKKIILYANPGTEGFYRKLGFLDMNTAMAIWHDPAGAVESGILRVAEPR